MESDNQRRKNIRVLIGTNFLQGIGWGIFYTIYQSFLLTYIPSETKLGLLISCMFLVQFLPMPIFGKLSDKIGRKSFILIGMFIPMIGLGLLGLANEFSVIILGIFLFFFGWSIRDPAFQSSMNENIIGSKSGIIFSISFFCFFGGNLLANILIFVASKVITHPEFFLIFCGLYVIQFLIIFFFYKELQIKRTKDSSEIDPSKKPKSIWKEIMNQRNLRPIFLFFLIDSLIWSTGVGLFNGSLESQLGIADNKIALILMGYNVAVLCGQLPLGKMIDKIGPKKSLIIAEIFGMLFFGVTIISAFLQSSLQLWMLFGGQFLYGIVLIFYIPAQLMIFTNSKRDNAAETYGIGSLMIGIGAFPATMLAGLLIEKIHFIAPLIFAIVLLPLNLLIVMKKFKDHNFTKETQENEPSNLENFL